MLTAGKHLGDRGPALGPCRGPTLRCCEKLSRIRERTRGRFSCRGGAPPGHDRSGRRGPRALATERGDTVTTSLHRSIQDRRIDIRANTVPREVSRTEPKRVVHVIGAAICSLPVCGIQSPDTPLSPRPIDEVNASADVACGQSSDGSAGMGAAPPGRTVGRVVFLFQDRRWRASTADRRALPGCPCRARPQCCRVAQRASHTRGAAIVERAVHHGLAQQCRAVQSHLLGTNADRFRLGFDPERHCPALYPGRQSRHCSGAKFLAGALDITHIEPASSDARRG
jgi:hypothetical protein